MPNPVPTPVAAALGLVPTVLDSAKALPGKVIQLPVLAVSAALTTLDAWQREYEALVGRGERFVASLRGSSDTEAMPLQAVPDVIEDTVEDALAKVTDLLDKAAEKVTPTKKVKPAKQAPVSPIVKATEVVDKISDIVGDAVPEAEAPKGEPTPSAPSGEVRKHDTAATPEVVETVEAVIEDLPVSVPTPDHDALPLADYDHMTLGSLRGRLRSLSVAELAQVRAYEKGHADRLPVITLLDNRIAKLATDAAAAPSPGGEAPVLPSAAPPAAKAPKKAPETKAPATKVRKS